MSVCKNTAQGEFSMTEGFLQGRALHQVLKEMVVVKDSEELRRERKNSYILTNFKILEISIYKVHCSFSF